MVRQVCVVGAGVIGLSSAVHIQETVPDVHVTLIAEKFSPNTVSDVAGGFWTPFAIQNTPIELQRRWGEATIKHLVELATSTEAKDAGVFPVSGYWLNKEKPQIPWWSDLWLAFRELSDKELHTLFPDYKYGFHGTSIMSDPSKYMGWILNRFKRNRGSIQQRKVHSLEELYSQYDAVVNCCGINAKELLDDTDMVPIRGQVMKVKAPWVKYFVIAYPEGNYVLPRTDTVVMGGTFQEGNTNLQISEKDRQKIWKGCSSLIPSLKSAEVLSHHAGLRPARDRVRLEMEQLHRGGKTITLVHNYGHGGSGWTLQWGCGQEVAQLVAKGLQHARL